MTLPYQKKRIEVSMPLEGNSGKDVFAIDARPSLPTTKPWRFRCQR